MVALSIWQLVWQLVWQPYHLLCLWRSSHIDGAGEHRRGCSPELVRFVWQELKLDNFEDVHDIKQLTEISKTYEQMIKQTEKLRHLYGTLPEDERQRLNIEAQLQGFVHGADKLVL